MAIFKKGNMWDRFGKVDLFYITTNDIVRNGRLVMGAGIAKEARDRLPGIDRDLANNKYIMENELKLKCLIHSLWLTDKVSQIVGTFQVKEHFKDRASIEIIKHSCHLLLAEISNRPTMTVALNFPGIGYGGLNKDEVLPIISILPDNVEIWEKE